jgi:LPS-assembly protein
MVEGGPWSIKADTVEYFANTQTYEARGQVEIRQGDRRITADYIRVHAPTKIAHVQGNVVMVLEGDILSGQVGNFNLATRCGELEQARLFLKRNHFHVNSALIRRTGDNSYYAEKSVVTTCDADRPMWSFYSRELDIVVDGYATGKSSVMKVGPIPIMYLPVAVVPVKTTRQSGLLMPQYGQHRAGGSVVEVPFYWAINNYSDATFYQMYLSSRGYMQGAEYRYASNKSSGGTVRFSAMSDGRSDAPTPQRYWFAGMMNQDLPADWRAKADLDVVSDHKFLRDFNFGYLGLNRYSRALLGDYGRNFEQDDVKTRVSTLMLNRNFSQANLTFMGRYYDRLNISDPRPFNKVPSLNFNTLMIPVGDWPVFFGLDSSYNHYYQDHGLTGQRLDLHPQVYVPVRLFNSLDVYGQLGGRETVFRVDNKWDQQQFHTYVNRQLFDAKAGVTTALSRDYGRESDTGSYVRHILRPEVTYWNMPNYTPTRYPKFDPFDQGWVNPTNRNLPVLEGDNPLGGVNAITYSLTNNFLRRAWGANGLAQISDLFWFRVSQSAFFNRMSYGLDGTPQPHHRMSDVLGEFRVHPWQNLGLGVDLGTSPYQEGLNRVDLRMTLHDQNSRNYLNLDYLYLKDYANQINAEVFLDLFRSIKVGFSNQHTFISNKRLETKYGLIFQRQCWGISLNFADRTDDKRVSFTIFIPGLIEKLPQATTRQQADFLN